jgi:hypothetical protein
VRSLAVSCWQCRHEAIRNADHLPDHIIVPSFGPIGKSSRHTRAPPLAKLQLVQMLVIDARSQSKAEASARGEAA